MRLRTSILLLLASCVASAIQAGPGSAVHAQARGGAGVITSVDLATNTLVFETRTGTQHLRLTATATIRDDHGAVLSIRDLAPGDAVSYVTGSETVAGLRVARQFWAIPPEW